MHWIDWLITIIPVVLIMWLAVYSRKYVRGVVDFLAAGRVAGRYVISVGDLQMGLSVITLVALCEQKYQTGFGLAFWEVLYAPLSLILALTGYCLYRFRETKALSIGQFLEMRYSRHFRIFAAILRTLAEMLTNAIGPAVAARFFIYFLGVPQYVNIFGCEIQTFVCVVTLVLVMALVVMWTGGRISLLITDCFQGLISYPIFVIIAGYVVLNFSWSEEIAPVMLDRAMGESFFNPFDVENLRDFNIFATITVIVSTVLNRASWVGNDTSGAGRTPHEQKMAGIIGAWRNGFSVLMCILIAAMVITVMSHQDFSGKARDIRVALSDKVAEEVFHGDSVTRAKLNDAVSAIPEQRHRIGVDAPLSQSKNIDTIYFETAHQVIGDDPEGNAQFQQYRTLYQQQMMAVTLKKLFPVGMAGLFILLMIMLMLSTDDGRIFNSSSTIIQDVLLPLRKKPLTPQQHLWWLRICSLVVCVFFFCCALLFSQMDYINMFINIMGSMWCGGAGPVMVFGLYSRFGNTAGAYASIFTGSGISVFGVLMQRYWPETVYPFIVNRGWVESLDAFLRTVSAPFDPYVVWQMDPVKFPINSFEIFFLAMALGTLAYVVFSLISFRKPYNLDRMLHRGEYAIDGERNIKSAWSWRTLFSKLIGITPEYTRGDRLIAWAVFVYSLIYEVLISFVLVLIWNLGHFFSWIPWQPWPAHWWSTYFFIVMLLVPAIVGVISTVWFMWGGIVDMRALFRDLAARVDNPLDDGRVVGHVSVADAAAGIAADKDEK